jgi:hypothetical protein
VRDVILDGEITREGGAYHVFDVMWLDGRDVMSLRHPRFVGIRDDKVARQVVREQP